MVEVTDLDLEAGVNDIVRMAKISKDANQQSGKEPIQPDDLLGDDMGQGLRAKDVDEEVAAIADELEGTVPVEEASDEVREPEEDTSTNAAETVQEAETTEEGMQGGSTTTQGRRGLITDKYLKGVQWATAINSLAGKDVHAEATKQLKDKNILQVKL